FTASLLPLYCLFTASLLPRRSGETLLSTVRKTRYEEYSIAIFCCSLPDRVHPGGGDIFFF
ncbi:MAG: hypothetical protein MUQ48_05855, partial [Pirellulales bacterium]|nr:hypothetical protein [Pirellulales bacterium]